MYEGMEVPNLPGGKIIRNLGFPTSPLVESPTSSLLQRKDWYWIPGNWNGEFLPNVSFSTPEELHESLAGLATIIDIADVGPTSHAITIVFDHPIGISATSEILPEEVPIRALVPGGLIKYPANIVYRDDKPVTELLTVVMKPVSTGSGRTELQVVNAFPGESLPVSSDDPYWENHAVVVDTRADDFISQRILDLRSEYNAPNVEPQRQSQIEQEVWDLKEFQSTIERARELTFKTDAFPLVQAAGAIRQPLDEILVY